MAKLMWDRVGSRQYENGLDQGVLYLPNGLGVPWNGLTNVIESFNNDTSPVYYDGVKVNDLVKLGDFEATLKAVTYPEELSGLEGSEFIASGVLATNQRPKTFGLCYRTSVGNDLEGAEASYKIHILYNVTAIPQPVEYQSLSDNPALVEFEWKLTAVPEEVGGHRPTAHYVIESEKVDPWLLEELEDILYGGTGAEAALLPLPELIGYIQNWFRMKITDNGDGTWTAEAMRDGFIDLSGDLITLMQANAIFIDPDTYVISSTISISDLPQIKIFDNGDGTWTASTTHNNLIVMLSEDQFEIRDATIEFSGPDIYRITDTVTT